jgi:hypothetical protein
MFKVQRFRIPFLRPRRLAFGGLPFETKIDGKPSALRPNAEHAIMSDKAQFFDPILSYEHSVEWIAVDVRKSTNSDSMLHGDW